MEAVSFYFDFVAIFLWVIKKKTEKKNNDTIDNGVIINLCVALTCVTVDK